MKHGINLKPDIQTPKIYFFFFFTIRLKISQFFPLNPLLFTVFLVFLHMNYMSSTLFSHCVELIKTNGFWRQDRHFWTAKKWLHSNCTWFAVVRQAQYRKHWYGPFIFGASNAATIWTICLKREHVCASTEHRLPSANHLLQLSPTWAPTVRTRDKVFGTARLLWASQTEVAVAVGDHWAVRRFLGWKKEK